MSLIKLTAVANAERALAIETALSAQQDGGGSPAPLAMSRFEAALPLWRVEAYFDDSEKSAVVTLATSYADAFGMTDWQIDPVPDENWVAHVHATLKPVRAGRFVIHGPHDRATEAGAPFAIEIEASEAFGTAHHGSTVGCLKAIDSLDIPAAARVLDLGTGSGILAIAVAKRLPDARIIATDIDARSVEIARANCLLNGVAAQVACLTASGLDHDQLQGARFDVILANILAGPLVGLAPRLAAALLPGGSIILAGLLDEQAPEVEAAYAAAGCSLQTSDSVEGWTTLIFRSV